MQNTLPYIFEKRNNLQTLECYTKMTRKRKYNPRASYMRSIHSLHLSYLHIEEVTQILIS